MALRCWQHGNRRKAVLGGGRSELEMIRAGDHLSGGSAFPNQPHLEASPELGSLPGLVGAGRGARAGAEAKLPCWEWNPQMKLSVWVRVTAALGREKNYPRAPRFAVQRPF